MKQSLFPLPLVVVIGSSWQLRVYLALAHVAGVGAVFLAALPPLAKWSGLILTTISLLFHLRPRPRLRLRGNEEGAMEVWLEEKWQTANISSNSVVWPIGIVLRVAIANQRRYRNLLVLPDSMPASDFRRLRVWLRWRGKPMHSLPGSKNENDQ